MTGTHVELVADNEDDTLEVRHGDHAGTSPYTVPTGIGGAEYEGRLVLTCPTCGAVSTWPVTGGAEPSDAAELTVASVKHHGRHHP